MNNEKVSIIVPIYNVEKYIKECINSIMKQTYTNIEIILVDDGSKDQSGKICDEYSKKDTRIRVVHKKNGGLSSARNLGIELATGEYLFFIDSDDILFKNSIEVLVNCLKQSGAEIVLSRFTRNENDLTKIDTSFSFFNLSKDEIITKILLQRDQSLYSVASPTKLFKRNIFENIRYPEGQLNEDMGIILLLIHKAKQIGIADFTSYYYRVNDDSITNLSFSKKRMDLIKMTRLMQSQIADYFPKHEDEGKILMFSRAFELYAIANATTKKDEFYSDKEILRTLIKENRRAVLKNGYARKKAVISSLLSYFSIDFVGTIIMHLKKASK